MQHSMAQRKPLMALIRDRGMRAGWIADRCGISRSQLSRIASGERRMSPDLAERIAALLLVPPEEVMRVAEVIDGRPPAPAEEADAGSRRTVTMIAHRGLGRPPQRRETIAARHAEIDDVWRATDEGAVG